MKKRIVLSLTGFVVVHIVHASYVVIESKRLAERWRQMSEVNYLSVYVERSDYLIGASYALAAGFSIYAMIRFLENRKKGLGGLLGGITMTGVLYVAGCFLLGCCGSPMLAVYLTLFGSSFLGFAKPLTFALTLVSVVVGYIWMERSSDSADLCCEGEEKCKPT